MIDNEKIFIPTATIGLIDAGTLLQKLDLNSVDLIFTDFPYESLDKYRAIGTTTRLKDSWFPSIPNSDMEFYFKHMKRVLKNNSHFYFMTDSETMFFAKEVGERYFKFWKPIVWDKVTRGMGYHYPNQTEFILFFEKGKRKLNYNGVPDTIKLQDKTITNSYDDFQRAAFRYIENNAGDDGHDLKLMIREIISSMQKESSVIVTEKRIFEKRMINGRKISSKEKYPTRKPVPLIAKFIQESSNERELVLDPFMGSGSTMEACLKLNRNFIGGDILEHALEYSVARLIKLHNEGLKFQVDFINPENQLPYYHTLRAAGVRVVNVLGAHLDGSI